jgi:hypothetical protein
MASTGAQFSGPIIHAKRPSAQEDEGANVSQARNPLRQQLDN